MVKPPSSEEELLDILPEIKKIGDNDLKEEVINVFLNHAPNYFWRVPASSSGNHHQKDVIGDTGLVIHTKRTFTALDRLGEAFVRLKDVDRKELDYARAGVLLHDIFKQGLPPSNGHTQKDHDVIAADYLEMNTDLPKEVIRCVHTHNGDWYAGDKPDNDLEFMHHLADMVGSGKYIYSSVESPNGELKDVMVDNFPKGMD